MTAKELDRLIKEQEAFYQGSLLSRAFYNPWTAVISFIIGLLLGYL